MITKINVVLVLVVLVLVVWFSINCQFQDVRLEAGNTARFPCSVKCYHLIKSIINIITILVIIITIIITR